MRGFKLTALVVSLSFVALFCFAPSVFGQAKPVSLNYTTHMPAKHGLTIMATEWGQEIEKRTQGKVKFTVMSGGTLLSADKAYDGIVKGIADVGLAVPGFTKGRFPLSEVLDLPLGYKSATAATRLANIYYNKFKPKEFDDVKVMYLHAHGPGIVNTKTPVSKLEELKGMKIACHGLSSKIVGALGAVPVAMPMPERYDAIQKGVAEGGVFPQEALKGWKLGEVVKFTTLNYGSAYTTGFFVVMNKEKWASLPADIQKIIEEINAEWIIKTGQGWDEIDKEGAEFGASKGIKTIALSKEEDGKWHALVQPVLDDYVKDMKAKNLPGEEALKFCQEELAKLQK